MANIDRKNLKCHQIELRERNRVKFLTARLERLFMLLWGHIMWWSANTRSGSFGSSCSVKLENNNYETHRRFQRKGLIANGR